MKKLIVKCKICNTAFVKDITTRFHQQNCCTASCFIRHHDGERPMYLKPESERRAVKIREFHRTLQQHRRHKRRKEQEREGRTYRNARHQTDSFFMSREWFELRHSVLEKYGRECMCCGATKGTMQVDHIKPRSKFPSLELDFDNLQVLCRPCNRGKSNISHKDYRPKVAIIK